MKITIKYNLQKDGTPIWVEATGEAAAEDKIRELKEQGYFPVIDKSRTQRPWLDLKALGLELYKINTQAGEDYIVVSKDAPVSSKIERILIEGGFSKAENGFKGKSGLRTTAALKTLPGAKSIFVYPDEIDFQVFLKNQSKPEENEAPMVGKSWSSSLGQREVVNFCRQGGETLYCVKSQTKNAYDWFLATDLKQIIAQDEDPDTKWRDWEVVNPNEQIRLPKGYQEYHILNKGYHASQKLNQKVVRVAGKPVSLSGYEEFTFFMAKHDGQWAVYEQTTGQSVTSTNSFKAKTQKDAVALAMKTLEKHADNAEKLSAHLSNQNLIPLPGQVPLPPPEEKEFSIPDLQTYDDALDWIKQKTKDYGGKSIVYASDEYNAVYPTIKRLHDQYKENMILETRQAVADAGLSSGDEVVYISPDRTSSLQGNLYFANTGMPRVRVHTENSLLGGQIPSNKRLDWHDGWDRTDPQNLRIAACDDKSSNLEQENSGLMP